MAKIQTRGRKSLGRRAKKCQQNNGEPSGAEGGRARTSPHAVLFEFLRERIPEYRELIELREEGWANPTADDHFERERANADHASSQGKERFYTMTCNIGNELDRATGGALTFNLPKHQRLAVLDLGMAPGGFTTAALTHNRFVSAYGISLPVNMGGYEIRMPRWRTDQRIVSIRFLDITMLATEMGVDIETEIPATHPDAGRFLDERPFLDQTFDLVFCGGTVVRNHERSEYREGCERTRLVTSQLVLAFNRIRPGGTLVLVMRRADSEVSVEMMHRFSKFADIQLFKPGKAHARKSSFYMVAQNVQSESLEAAQAVKLWKKKWREVTLGRDVSDEMEVLSPDSNSDRLSADGMESLLAEFGERLVELTRPVFKTQANALRTAPWRTKKDSTYL
ncbi:hypothetical protein OQA88_1767 [Cercophora sp. LCS_1]